MPQYSNRDKQERGQNAKNSLESILVECQKYSYITNVEKEFRCGYKEFDQSQFYSNFLISFKDNSKWILYTTTSCRTDRIKVNQWDSYNIKKIDSSVKKSILIYPDSVSDDEKQSFIAYNLKIQNKVPYNELAEEDSLKLFFSAIDYVISQSEFFELVEYHANQGLSCGQKKDKQGNVFESYIAGILSNTDNFYKWKNDNKNLLGMNFPFFEKIVSCLNIDKLSATSIQATADKKTIGNLFTSGKPKTDIIVKVSGTFPEVKCYTISCKRSAKKSISAHQYSADAFADVLDEHNSKLRKLLNDFQKVGNLRDFGTDKEAELSQELKPYIHKLIKWVLGGHGGKNKNTLQIAEFILIYDEKNLYIHNIDDYINILLKNNIKGNFGTPFQWTYASGCKGKNIQLKCKILK